MIGVKQEYKEVSKTYVIVNWWRGFNPNWASFGFCKRGRIVIIANTLTRRLFKSEQPHS